MDDQLQATGCAGARGNLGGTRPSPIRSTPRERQVRQLVAEGKSTKDIAVILDLTVETADYYRLRIMSKLNIHNIAGLVRDALRHGLIELAVAGCCWCCPPPLPTGPSHRPSGQRQVSGKFQSQIWVFPPWHGGSGRRTFRTMRILLAEDHQIVREGVRS